MEPFNLKDKEVFVFDAFGTLFSTASPGKIYSDIAGNKADDLLKTWRKKQLEYSWLRNQMNQYVPFDQVTKEALQYAMDHIGISDQRIFEILLPIYNEPGLIDGAKELLDFLNRKNRKIVILSNGTLTMLQNGIVKTKIDGIIDLLISVDSIGVYKPDPKVYEYAINQIGEEIGKIVFFSSNQWDVSGASTFGLDTVWINQYQETKEVLPFGATMETASLSQLIY